MGSAAGRDTLRKRRRNPWGILTIEAPERRSKRRARLMGDREGLKPASNGMQAPPARVYALRWPDGREERASGSTPAAAALSLGYGFDDFKDLTWEEQA